MILNENVNAFIPDLDRLDERLRARHAHASEISGGFEGRRRPRSLVGDSTRSNRVVIEREIRDRASVSGRWE